MKKNLRLILSLFVTFPLLGCSLFFGDGHQGNREKSNDSQINKKSVRVLSPQARLKKLSFHLRGIGPSRDEFQELNVRLNQGSADLFFEEKLSSYMKSPEYLGKMIEKLDELFGVSLNRTPTEYEYFELNEKIKPSSTTLNSMDLLFRKVIKENLNWDTLFTGKEYQITFPAIRLFNRPSDLGFFNAIKTGLPLSSDGVVQQEESFNQNVTERILLPVNFNAEDSRIGGAITTSRFLSRYNTTLLNKNRKRAAALFRILLCDDMKPTVAANEDTSDLLLKSFPKGENAPNIVVADQIKHGTMQSCMACHQKLDPMGETFRTTGNVLSPAPSSGALVYPTHENRTVNIPVRGIGHLTQVISEQPEYLQCQVRHFWNWFVGKDKSLTTERLHQLVQEFEHLKRRPNDFISFLLREKEFLEDESGSFSLNSTFTEVRPLLSRCTNCHSGVTSKNIPSFVKMPFGGSNESHKKWIKYIVSSLDLAGDGKQAKMPTPDAGWTLSLQDRENLRNWINQGAQDEKGIKTIDDLSIPNQDPRVSELQKNGAFGNLGIRYLASNDLLRFLKQKFPLTWAQNPLLNFSKNLNKSSEKKEPDEVICISSMDRKALGFFNPANIEPSYPGPSLSYVKWLSKCLLAFSKKEFELIKKNNLNFDSYLGPKALESLTGTEAETLRKEADTFPWSKVPAEVKAKIASHLVQEFIGPKVALREDDIIQTAFTAADAVSTGTSAEAIQRILLVAILQDEFLTY